MLVSQSVILSMYNPRTMQL